ncbi:ABC transporter ATP-binding protein [Desulfosudis oleivorans]|uniref:Multidrug resistance-like ATP-binding protein MdlA n=1 Tax=Desulfosudis oleivorans (strain DSM 6200 / JCM 39069 / Hxd3) TaxID=96561 RepID=A9A0B0_DESOH|nr:ABC transporter ATP-binding protein [Desulfosudis oleivorans]ABW69029.1 ABC transporter-related protein [Desulfosudis oleivorans Hxd3]
MAEARAKEFLLSNRWELLAGLVSLVLVDAFQLLIPRVVKRAVDDLTLLAADLRSLAGHAAVLLAMALVIAVFRYVWRRCLIGTSRTVERDLRARLAGHLQTLDAAYFNVTSTGDLMARVTNDINNIRMAMGLGLVALIDAVFLGIAAIGFMAYINVELTLYSLLPMPMIVILTRFFSRRMHKMYLAVQAAFSDMTEVTRERFAGIRVIKAFDRKAAEAGRFSRISEDYIRKNLDLTRVTGTFFPLMLLFTNISIAIVLYVGGRQTIAAQITIGDFVAFLSYLTLITWPMMAMGWVANLMQRGRASLDRINQVLAASPEIKEASDPRPLPHPGGALSFRNVSFSYAPGGKPVLSDIHLDLPAGKILCIVGPPGSGKTTLVHLMARLYDPDTGTVAMDGMDLRAIRIADLRAAVAFMPQEPFLFSGTIRENIAFDDTVADDNPKLVDACRNAGLLETVFLFSNGFDTIVGEKGVILSGGQKQRVALARALYHAAPVMILDDPVSQVDTETAGHILSALQSAARTRTAVFVSHRLSLARLADRVIVLENGRITAEGTHEQLMTTSDYYARSWALQRLEEEAP